MFREVDAELRGIGILADPRCEGRPLIVDVVQVQRQCHDYCQHYQPQVVT